MGFFELKVGTETGAEKAALLSTCRFWNREARDTEDKLTAEKADSGDCGCCGFSSVAAADCNCIAGDVV